MGKIASVVKVGKHVFNTNHLVTEVKVSVFNSFIDPWRKMMYYSSTNNWCKAQTGCAFEKVKYVQSNEM